MTGARPSWTARAGARLLRTRLLVRAPIRLYALGLGPVLGRRVLMLEHRGRRSGVWRRVVLENLADAAAAAPAVVSGFAERSQWCRNLRADPRVRVWWGTRRPCPATAVPLDRAEARRLVGAYAAAHPRAWRRLAPTMAEVSGRDVAPGAFDLPVFRLVLDGGGG